MQTSVAPLAPEETERQGQSNGALGSAYPASEQSPFTADASLTNASAGAPMRFAQSTDISQPAERIAEHSDSPKLSESRTAEGSEGTHVQQQTSTEPPRGALPPVATRPKPTGQDLNGGRNHLTAPDSVARLQASEDAERAEPKEEAEDAGPTGRHSTDAVLGVAAGRRGAIKPKKWAGSVVWAKLAKYPWWPAQVLDENDPWIPNDTEMPRHGAIPVRFFGTYDFAWIESQRAICPIDQDYEEHSSKSKQKSFMDGLVEAKHFQETQELPDGFNEDTTPSPQKAPKKSKGGGKGKGKRGEAGASGKGAKRGTEDSAAHRRSVRERQDSIMQTLALVPPADSPYSHSINLDGVRKLMELQKAGQYPPPAPQQTQQFTQPAFAAPFSSAQFSGGHFTGAQFPAGQFSAPVPQQMPAAQSQQLQNLQQQLQAAGQGRPQWPLHFPFNPQLPLSFFQAQGGVQGALLAAASQGQLQPKQF